MKKWLKNQKGFTLVELLAVIVILGVIAAIAVPSIGNVISGAREDSAYQSALMIRDAADRYLMDNPPADVVTTVAVADLVTGGYLRETPVNPNSTSDPQASFTTVNITVSSGSWTIDSVEDADGTVITFAAL